MKRFLSLLAALAVAALAVAGTGSAQAASTQTGAGLPAPPTGSNTASSSIFDALLAIERAGGSNPRAVQPASVSYLTAIRQYNAGDLQSAHMSALTAISQTGAVPLPAPSINAPAIPQPPYLTMPAVLNTDQADAESYVGLARKSVMLCGAPGAPIPDAVQTQYRAAVDALLAKNSPAARIAANAVVTQCSAAAQAYAATLQTQPAPAAMGSYQPEPIATMGPDPALAATPEPVMMPPATPAARRGFL
jgi:hypothetical protein